MAQAVKGNSVFDLSITGKSYLCVLLPAFASILIVSQLFPFFYETGNDVHARIVSSGTFSGLPEGLLSSYGCFVLLSKAYAGLTIWFPAINWFDLFGIFFLSVMVCHFIILLRIVTFGKDIYFKVAGISVMLLLLLNLVQSEPTRTGMLISGSSLLLLYKFDQRLSPALRIWIYSMIISGLLIRVESGLLALVLVQLSAYITQQDKLSIFKKSLPVNLLTVILLIFINWPTNAAEGRYLDIRPYQFTLWDYHNEHDNVILNSKTDTVKLATAKRSFLADEEALSPSFFESIRLQPTDKTPGDLLNYFQNTPEQTARMAEYFEKYVLGYPFLSVAYILLLLFLWNRVGSPVKILTQSVLFLISIAVIAFFMKMEWRLYYPLLSLSLLTIFTLPTQRAKIIGPDKLLALLLLLTAAANTFTVSVYYYARKTAIKKELQVARNALSSLPLDAIVLLDKNSLINWYGYYFQKVNMNELPLIIPYDNGLLFTQNSHKEFLRSTLGCSDFECVTRSSLLSNNTYLLADDNRKQLLVNYLREVYSIVIIFESVKQHTQTIIDRSHHNGLHLHKISIQ
jgi:hypothetical protein